MSPSSRTGRSEVNRDAEDAVRHGVGKACYCHWTRGRPFAFSPRFHADSEHWYDQFKRLGLDGQSARSRGKAHIEAAEGHPNCLEGRRRVKEQLKKMGSFEYHQTSFSYTLQETGEEKFVGVPEQGGRDLISTDALSPGTVYTAGVTSDGVVGLYRLRFRYRAERAN